MPELARFPYFQIQFDREGTIFDTGEVDSLLDAIEPQEITDLVLVSHGWKNDIEDATNLYAELIGNIRAVLDAGSSGGLPGRKLGFVGLFWPSKKFTPVELQPGGGASLDGAISEDMILEELDSLRELSDVDDAEQLIEQAKALVIDLEDRKTAQDKFVKLVQQILADDGADAEIDEEVPPALDTRPGRDIIDLLSRPGRGEVQLGRGGAAGIGNLFNGIKGGVMNFLNMTTYWKMKKRAGKVGQKGVHEILRTLSTRFPDLAIHLVGHSFGGRLVSAAVRGPDNAPAVRVKTLSLLQAAFSHYGFAENFDADRDGYFRRVVTQHNVAGPVLITHTKNDKAVGLAYPLASRVNRDDSAALGDEHDRFGGIGRNGAQRTPEAVQSDLQNQSGAYTFEPGKFYNLKADDFIANHGDVRNSAIANMIVNGIASV